MVNLDKNTDGELDVRVLVPIQRHELLIRLFKELPVDEHFVFINDHDPLPLFYEFRSIYGDVVGWDYLNRGGREWKVKVTRLEASQGVEFKDISTLLDLRKANQKEWKQIVFHRYGMMEPDTTMELISALDPVEIHQIFINKFEGRHKWIYKRKEDGEYVVHITKLDNSGLGDEGFSVINEFDLRPFPLLSGMKCFIKPLPISDPGKPLNLSMTMIQSPFITKWKQKARNLFVGNIWRKDQRTGR